MQKRERKSESKKKQTIVDYHKMSPEEYLRRTGVTTYLKDIITLLLENRPEDCLQFISD